MLAPAGLKIRTKIRAILSSVFFRKDAKELPSVAQGTSAAKDARSGKTSLALAIRPTSAGLTAKEQPPLPAGNKTFWKAKTSFIGVFGKLKQAWAKIQALPPSFRYAYLIGVVSNAVGQEIQSVALPKFSAQVLGGSTALFINLAGYVVRIAGVWMGVYFMSRFHPNKVNIAALISMALGGAAVAFVGIHSPYLFGLLLFNAVVGGLAYGITRGIVENLLPRMIMGSVPEDAPEPEKQAKKSQLNLGLNYLSQWVEIGAFISALWVAEPLLRLVGGSRMMAISGALIGLTALLHSLIKFKDKWTKPQPSAAAKPRKTMDASKPGGWKEYLPLIYARYNHFLTYGVTAVILGLAIFPNLAAQIFPHTPQVGATGLSIGIYDIGSWGLSLLASLALIPKRLTPRGLGVLLVAAATGFLWSAVLGAPLFVILAFGGLLGGIITLNTNEWMSRAQQSLSEQKLENLSKWVMTWAILAMFPLAAVIAAVRISPVVAAAVPLKLLLGGIAAFDTLAGLLMLWLMPKSSSKS